MTIYTENENRVTSGFRLPDRSGHNGIDLKRGKAGSQKNPSPSIRMPVDCTIEYVSTAYNYGRGTNLIGKWVSGGKTYRLRLQHLKSYSVEKGQPVKAGEFVAVEGATGDCRGEHPEHTHAELVVGGTLQSYGEITGGTIIDPSALLSIRNVSTGIFEQDDRVYNMATGTYNEVHSDNSKTDTQGEDMKYLKVLAAQEKTGSSQLVINEGWIQFPDGSLVNPHGEAYWKSQAEADISRVYEDGVTRLKIAGEGHVLMAVEE